MRKVLLVSMTLIALVMCLMAIPARADRPTQAEIDEAIQKGLAWLAAQQRSDGSWGPTNNYDLGNTASAVLAFEDEGHFPGSASIYSDIVEKGLEYIFSRAYIQTPLPVQNAGDPDSDGDGQGVYFQRYRSPYETGMCLLAIAASNTPDRVVGNGVCADWTYEEVVEDVVDWIAYAQSDGGGRGGWRYSANYGSSDNSAAQWPVLGLIAAEQWGYYAPDWVKTELEFWVNYSQNSNGGGGYDNPNSPNVGRTGALLVQQYWLGDEADESTRVQNAINYVDNLWDQAASGFTGNKINTYAMFAVYKGLAILGVDTLPSVVPDNDWWLDYAEVLVDSQIDVGADQGYWNGSYSTYYNNSLATGFYIVILQATIFPVDVDVNLPVCACEVDGYDVEVEYSVQRFQVSGSLEICMDDVLVDTVTLTDFQGSDTYIYTVAPGTDGATVGTHTWLAKLDATTAESVAAQAEDTDSIDVYVSPAITDIPDQVIPDYTVPFVAFDLDDYLAVADDSIIWSATAPEGWVVDIDSDNVVTVTAPSADPGTITFTAGVESCAGVVCSDSDDAIFDPNTKPVADIMTLAQGCDLITETPIDYDGTGSYDADGDQLTYSWYFDDGTEILDSDQATMSHVYQASGVHVATLIVNDGLLDSDPDTVTVTLEPKLKLLSVRYDVVTTMLTFEFNKPVQPFPICFGKIGMNIVECCEEYQCGWDILLSNDPNRNLEAEETKPNATLNVDINRAHPATVNLAVAALVQHLPVDLLLMEGAFIDECGGLSPEVTCEDEIAIQMITHGYVLGNIGDVTGDGEISPLDAALILQDSAGVPEDEVYPIFATAEEISNWLAALGNSHDLMLSTADMSGNGVVTAFDAAQALRVSIGLDPVPMAPGISGAPKKVALKVSSFDNQKLTVTINLNDVANVYSADMILTYDPQSLTITDVSGTAATAEWLTEHRAEPGRLRISMAGASQPVANGSLVTMSFDVDGSREAIEKLNIADFRLNGGQLRATIENLPKLFALLQNYPNPFNPETWIPYRLSEAGDVSITIYNVNGQMVRQLHLGSKMPGYYVDKSRAAYWDGANESGEAISSGIYFYQMQAGQNTSVKKMIIVR